MTPKGLEISDFMDIARTKTDVEDDRYFPSGDWEQRMKFAKRISQGLSNVDFDDNDVELYPNR